MQLAILIGLQGAGKSTFYRQRLADTHVHVSKDLMPNNRRPERRQNQLVEAALRDGRSVAVDNTNPTLASRATLIALGHANGAEIVGYYFEPALKECLERNRARLDRERVPDIAIFATRKALVAPTYAEGFDHLYRVRALPGGEFSVEPVPAPSPSSSPAPASD